MRSGASTKTNRRMRLQREGPIAPLPIAPGVVAPRAVVPRPVAGLVSYFPLSVLGVMMLVMLLVLLILPTLPFPRAAWLSIPTEVLGDPRYDVTTRYPDRQSDKDDGNSVYVAQARGSTSRHSGFPPTADASPGHQNEWTDTSSRFDFG